MTNKKKLAIVTSYDELCGNAEYSDVLREGLSKLYDVTIVPLNMDIMRLMTRRRADKYIRNVSKQLRHFDYVNIQFESGLFGVFPRDILKRFRWLCKSSKKLIVTMHRVDVKKSLFSAGALQSLLQLQPSKFVAGILTTLRNNRFARLYSKVIKLCAKRGMPIVVHSRREKHRILTVSKFKARVEDHPLAYLTHEKASDYKNSRNQAQFLVDNNLPADAVTIGVFGFIAPYKGIPVLMKALPFLPANYHVLIFGSQHPLKVDCEPSGDLNIFKYINMMLPAKPIPGKKQKKPGDAPPLMLEWSNLSNDLLTRFHFLGGFYQHEDFIKAIAACDLVVFPYNEVGQSASGVLGLALDLGANIICSQTLAFLELMKYTGASLRTFSIGNHLELAEKIKIAAKQGVHSEAAIREYNQKYNLDTNAKFYADLFESIKS